MAVVEGIELTGTVLAEIAPLDRWRIPIAIGILGQSNERGNVLTAERAAFPQAFQSLRNPCVQTPIGPSVTPYGGQWFKMYDDLYDHGYDAHIVNGGIGSMGFVAHGAGIVTFRSNSTAYYQQRAAVGPHDRGYIGDLICPNGNKMFRCVVGRDIAAFNAGPFRAIGSTATYLDYLQFGDNKVTASSAPDFTSAAVGDLIEDGQIAWRCESLASGPYPGSGGSIFNQGYGGLGWDPLGIVQRLHDEMQRVRGVEERIIIIANGQSDAQGTEGAQQATILARYQAALTNMTQFFVDRGYKVGIGLTCYTPLSTTYRYDTLQTARQNTLNAFASNDNVFPAANLYATMGTNPSLQADDIHLDAQGAIEGGEDQADALKLILPEVSR